MLQAVGWFGALMFAFCGLPQAIKSVVDGHSKGLAWGFLGMWLVGELCTFAYVLPKRDAPLLFNYGFNILLVCIIVYYKIRPRPAPLETAGLEKETPSCAFASSSLSSPRSAPSAPDTPPQANSPIPASPWSSDPKA